MASPEPTQRSTLSSWARARAVHWSESGFLVDSVVRLGIRRLLSQRLEEIEAGDPEQAALRTERFIEAMAGAPIALVPEKANAQHYEVPAEFFELVLGPHRKYSSCYWPGATPDLGSAERAALKETCEHAGLGDQQHILELGCGWGSLTLWIAEQYPHSRITAVSNSHSQRQYIPFLRFDRIVSVPGSPAISPPIICIATMR
jgi:cyclopropane-fatty-acyl-phospholipid synthase